MTDFKQRVECLKELEKHVMPLNWETFGAANEKIVDVNGLFVAETCSDDDAAFIVAIRNNGVPLLQEMQAEIERLTAENEDFEERIEAAVDILNKDDPNQFSTIIASKFILEHGLKDVREALQ